MVQDKRCKLQRFLVHKQKNMEWIEAWNNELGLLHEDGIVATTGERKFTLVDSLESLANLRDEVANPPCVQDAS